MMAKEQEKIQERVQKELSDFHKKMEVKRKEKEDKKEQEEEEMLRIRAQKHS